MSPENMNGNNKLKYGARLTLEPDTKIEILSLNKEEFYAVSPFYTGNTKNLSPQVVVCFLDNNMNAERTKDSGWLQVRATSAIKSRLVRIFLKEKSIKNLYLFYRAYKEAQFIEPTLRDLLDPSVGRGAGSISFPRILVSCVLARDTVAHYGSVQAAAAHTNVPAAVFQMWLKLDNF